MIVKLNEKEYTVVQGITLFSFIENLGIKSQGIAIAINYEVIPKDKWKETILTNGIEMMLIHAVSGG